MTATSAMRDPHGGCGTGASRRVTLGMGELPAVSQGDQCRPPSGHSREVCRMPYQHTLHWTRTAKAKAQDGER